MSSKPMARQRIVPAIPHRLAIRRVKVVPAGKGDQQNPADKGKSATLSTGDESKASARENGINHGGAHKDDNDTAAPLADRVKDKSKQPLIEKKEPVATKQQVDEEKEFSELKQAVKSNEPLAKKEFVGSNNQNKHTNGVSPPSLAPSLAPLAPSVPPAPPARRQPHPQHAQARPFIPKHRPQHSASLVFGGLQDSSITSPANSMTAFMPPPPVPFMPPQVAPYDTYPPTQHTISPAPMAVMGPPPPVNGHSFAHTNGTAAHLGSTSSSPLHTPSMPLGDSATAIPDAHMSHKPHAPHPSAFAMSPVDSNVQNLVEFVLAHWGQSEFADYVLELYSGSQSSTPLMLPVHSIIIARYPGLLQLINTLPQSRTHTRAMVVHVPRSYYFQDASGFADALRFIYGGPLIEPMYIFSNSASSSDSRMRYALSYLAAGHCLNVEAVVAHAYRIALRILSFNALEAVLFFAVCGNCLREQCLYGPYADQIVWQALYLLVSNIYPDFVLDPSASELSSLPRLPTFNTSTSASQSRPESRSSSAFATSDAPPVQRRISTIRFGSATPSNSDTSSSNHILSSVLLSLPFDLLKIVLEHDLLVRNLGLEALLSIAGDVVRERERRRVDACNSLQDEKKNPEGVLLLGEAVGRDSTGTRLKLIGTRYG